MRRLRMRPRPTARRKSKGMRELMWCLGSYWHKSGSARSRFFAHHPRPLPQRATQRVPVALWGPRKRWGPRSRGTTPPTFIVNFRNRRLVAAALIVLSSQGASIAQQATTKQDQKAKPAQSGQQSVMGGISSAGSFAPVYDAEKRPITAGGFVTSGTVVFEDATKAAGLSGWQHVMGTKTKKYILETDGSGVGLIDYDNDGWLDIYMVNGSTYDALTGKKTPPHAALFHNNHDGTFTDVAAKAGVTNDRWGFGVAIADFDGDGWPDIFVCNFGKNRLYHTNHDGTFTDLAEKAGVTLGNWSDGATWGDYDGDGRLDLFVSGYVHYDLSHQPDPANGDVPFGDCQLHGFPVMCGPRGLPGGPDHLFHNNGDGTFTDVSVKAGVSDPKGYYGFASVFVDVDDDGWLDLAVANDSTPKYLYRNKHDGTFEDISYLSGFALHDDGGERAAMGIAVGDYNRDGKVDFYVTNFSDDYNTLYRNDGDGNFSDVTIRAQLA